MNKSLDRENIITNYLEVHGKLSTNDAISMLNISESSTRRLFAEMEKSNKVSRVYGGIKLPTVSLDYVYSFDELETKNSDAKQSIAQFAANLIENNDVIFLDCGTTILQLAIALKSRIQKSELHNISVLTNSLPNMNVLNDVCDVILIGGKYRSWRKDFSGFATEKFLRHFNYRKSFLGADGFDAEQGFTGSDRETARLMEEVITRSEKKYILLDASKLGVLSFVPFVSASNIDLAITDSSLTSEQALYCQNAGLSLSVAK